MSKQKKTALITGASAGIGSDIARSLAAKGCDVVLTARREDRLLALCKELEQNYKISATYLLSDLSKAGGVESLWEQIVERNLSIDVLVNNAGFGLQGDFSKQPVERQLEMLNLNIVALTHLTRLALPQMIERNQGNIMNVASMAAFVPGPFMAIYYATKAYVLSLSEALYEELRGTEVYVTCVCPGPVDTEFIAVANMQESPLMKMGAMSSTAVAKVAVDATFGKERVVIPGFGNKIAADMVPFIPRIVSGFVSRKLQGH